MSSPPSPRIAATIEKTGCVLDGIKLVEVVSVNVIDALLNSKLLLDKWDANNYSHHMAKQLYQNETHQLEEYKQKIKNNTVQVSYKKPKHGYGRAFVVNSLGFTAFRKRPRNTFIRNNYIDADINNAQPEIARNICRDNEIACPFIDKLCDDRDNCFKMVMDEWDVSRDVAKKLFLRIFFKGGVKGWCDEFGLKYKKNNFIADLIKELDRIAKYLKKNNSSFYECVRKNKEFKGEDDKNLLGSFFSLYLQEYEVRIVGSVLHWIIHNTRITKVRGVKGDVATYEFDGLKLPRCGVEAFGGCDELIDTLNKKTEELTGFKLKWAIKPIENYYDLAGVEDCHIVCDNGCDGSEDEVVEVVHINPELIIAMDYVHNFNERLHLGIAELVKLLAEEWFVFTNGEWFCWDCRKNKWDNCDRALKHFIMYNVVEHIEKLILKFEGLYNTVFGLILSPKTNDDYWTLLNRTFDKLKRRCFDNAELKKSVDTCKILLTKDTMKFDFKEHLLGFDNGVFDITENKFRPYNFDDYVSMSCGYDFEDLRNCTDKEYIDKIHKINQLLEQIFPNEEHRKLVLMILASGLYGRCIEKFFVFNGGGGNGKGFLNELMMYCLGDYGYNCDVSLLTSALDKNSNSPNPSLAGMDKKRYVIFKEPPADKKINNSTMKDITGGGVVKARMCYSNKTDADLHNTTGLEANVRPLLAEKPTQADARRIVDVLFGSTFSSNAAEVEAAKKEGLPWFLADASLKNDSWKADHRVPFMNILINYLIELRNEKFNIDKFVPDDVKRRGEEYLQSCFDVNRLFVSLYERVEIDKDTDEKKHPFVSLKDVCYEMQNCEEYGLLTKFEKRKMSVKNIKEFFETNFAYRKCFRDRHKYYDKEGNRMECRSVLLGWKLKIVEEVEEEVENDL